MNPIRNIIIVNDFNYIQGGASKVAIETAKRLSKQQIGNIYFFSAVYQEEAVSEGITYITTNQKEALKDENRIRGFFNGIYNIKAKREFGKLLDSLNKEETIIHVHGWTKALSSSVFHIAFKKGFKVVLTMHDYFTACPNGGYFNYKINKVCDYKPMSKACISCNCDSRSYVFKLYRILRQVVQNKIVRVNENLKYAISISDFSERVLKKTLNQNTQVIRVYNPIDTGKKETRSKVEQNQTYLYVGRISKEKGVDIFCQAVEQLGLKGIVVGDGEQKDTLQEQFKQIEFVGWKDKQEVKQYMKEAKMLLFPSRWYEAAPLTILEAMSIGLPCIVSEKCAGIDFIQDKIDGLVFNGDVEDLKSKIVNSQKETELLSQEAYKHYWQNYDNKEVYEEKILKAYQIIMKNGKDEN